MGKETERGYLFSTYIKIVVLLLILVGLLFLGYHLFIKKDFSLDRLIFWKKVDSKKLVVKLKKIVEKNLDKYVSENNITEKESYRLKMLTQETILTNEVDVAKVMGKRYTFSINLYFPDREYLYLSSEARTISIPQEDILTIANFVVKELLKGPRNPELSPCISPRVSLRAVYFNKGVLYLDFSSDINDREHLGSSGELFLIYSIVNTLGQFEEIKKVKFLVQGEEKDTFSTQHISLEDFFTPKPVFIKKK